MKKILYINACARPNSRTNELANYIISKMEGILETVELYSANLRPLDAEGIEKRNLAAESGDYSAPEFSVAKQFAAADDIVIAAPYWDLSFPSILKTYLEAVTVVGLSFKYSESGAPIGLCRGKRLFYVSTAGGMIHGEHMGFSYVSAVCKSFFGIEDAVCFSADGLDIFGSDANDILSKAKAKADAHFQKIKI